MRTFIGGGVSRLRAGVSRADSERKRSHLAESRRSCRSIPNLNGDSLFSTRANSSASVLVNMNRLTRRQQQILDFIEDEQTRRGLTPSTREIQEHFRFASQTAAVNHLRALERKGSIQRHPGKARGLSLIHI